MLRFLFITSLIFGLSFADEQCKTSGTLLRGTGSIVVEGTVTCDGKPLYGAYVQLVDNFQAVNDVVGHGHTDHDGGFKVSAQYYYYSDTDLAAAKGSWNIVVYSYCGINHIEKNQCHRVYKQTVEDKDSNGGVKCLKMKPNNNIDAADINLSGTKIQIVTNLNDNEQKAQIICLSGDYKKIVN